MQWLKQTCSVAQDMGGMPEGAKGQMPEISQSTSPHLVLCDWFEIIGATILNPLLILIPGEPKTCCILTSGLIPDLSTSLSLNIRSPAESPKQPIASLSASAANVCVAMGPNSKRGENHQSQPQGDRRSEKDKPTKNKPTPSACPSVANMTMRANESPRGRPKYLCLEHSDPIPISYHALLPAS